MVGRNGYTQKEVWERKKELSKIGSLKYPVAVEKSVEKLKGYMLTHFSLAVLASE